MLNLYPVKVYASANQFYCFEVDAQSNKPSNRNIHIVYILIGLEDLRSLFKVQGISSKSYVTYSELDKAIQQI